MPQPELIISQGTTTTAPPPDAGTDELRAALARAEERVVGAYELLRMRWERDQIVRKAWSRAREDNAALHAVVSLMRDRYHCKVSDPTQDLADTDEAAERVWKAGYMSDMAVYDLLVAALIPEHPGEALPAELAAARAEILAKAAAHINAAMDDVERLPPAAQVLSVWDVRRLADELALL